MKGSIHPNDRWILFPVRNQSESRGTPESMINSEYLLFICTKCGLNVLLWCVSRMVSPRASLRRFPVLRFMLVSGSPAETFSFSTPNACFNFTEMFCTTELRKFLKSCTGVTMGRKVSVWAQEINKTFPYLLFSFPREHLAALTHWERINSRGSFYTLQLIEAAASSSFNRFQTRTLAHPSV